jgi:8-oxo-dGTP pyrophosphatase MutT (NUDIX family)
MSGFLRHIHNLNRWNPSDFKRFYIAGQPVGYVKHHVVEQLSSWSQYFAITDDSLSLLADDSIEARSSVLAEVVNGLAARGIWREAMGEIYPVIGHERDEVYALLDRVAAGLFGIRTFGQHLNGYVHSDDGMLLWLARRDPGRIHFPNKLDNIVAGGLPYQLSFAENLRKECHEEAGMPGELADRAVAVGAIDYCRDNGIGLKPDTLYCYDIEMSADFVPRNTDGEVSEFILLPVQEVMRLVNDTDEFKLNCNLVFIDFFIRHGFIKPDHPHYLQLVNGLHNN